jgi:dihydrofolate reductase
MTKPDSRVKIHMAASLDGFVARRDGRVDWLGTADEFEGGDTLEPELVEKFLETIDCYVMGSRTYETGLSFDAGGFGWSFGDGIPFFERLDKDVALHLAEVKTFKSGIVELRYELGGHEAA